MTKFQIEKKEYIIVPEYCHIDSEKGVSFSTHLNVDG